MWLTGRTTARLGAVAATAALVAGWGAPVASAQALVPNGGTAPVIATVAGNGHPGFSGDGGLATSAHLILPTGVAEDISGNLYIADTLNFRVRRVTTAGLISTIAGTGIPGAAGDGGLATKAQLWAPKSPTLDGAGNLYIADSGNHEIRRVTPTGTITTVAGTRRCGRAGDGGPATAAQLCNPSAVASDPAGNLYIADTGNNEIRYVTEAGTISTLAGTGTSGSSGDNGPATLARLSTPTGVALDNLHDVFIADSANNKIRKVDTSGVITTFAGTGSSGFSGDGNPAKLAKLNHPSGLGVDPVGSVYILDSFNFRIRVVLPKGDIFTYAGTGIPGFSGDGGSATSARLSVASGDLAVDANNVFFADTLNERVRRVQGGPPPNIPESPFAILLPLSALAVMVGAYLLFRRRRGA
jgi:hypothetical protein